MVTEKAAVGVGEKGRGYGKDMITVSVMAYWQAKERITFDQIQHAMDLYKAEHDGKPPKTQQEFMDRIVKENNLHLPALPAGHSYFYDPEDGSLNVRKPADPDGPSAPVGLLAGLEFDTMKPHHTILFILTILVAATAHASDVSWMFQPGYYTHSPVTGERVAQYEPERPSYVVFDPTYQESGYRHELVYAGNDILNVVQTWGAWHGYPAIRRVGSIHFVPAPRRIVLGAIRKARGRCPSIPGRIRMG